MTSPAEFQGLPPEEQGVRGVADDLIREVSKAFSRHVVEREIADFIGTLLRRKRRSTTLRLLGDDLVDEVADSFRKDVAEVCVRVLWCLAIGA
jgi:hypothetical protein